MHGPACVASRGTSRTHLWREWCFSCNSPLKVRVPLCGRRPSHSRSVQRFAACSWLDAAPNRWNLVGTTLCLYHMCDGRSLIAPVIWHSGSEQSHRVNAPCSPTISDKGPEQLCKSWGATRSFKVVLFFSKNTCFFNSRMTVAAWWLIEDQGLLAKTYFLYPRGLTNA